MNVLDCLKDLNEEVKMVFYKKIWLVKNANWLREIQ